MAGKAHYIMSQGEIGRKDNSLCFRKEGKNYYLPIEAIQELYLMNETTVNTKLLDFLASHGILVHFFNYYGHYSGSFIPREKYLSGKVTFKQVEAFINLRQVVAKAIVRGTSKNIYDFLLERDRGSEKIPLEEKKFYESGIDNALAKATTIPEIMAVEGDIWYRFYRHFSTLLPEEFDFNKRVRRPPDNPVNALISFGNSMLYAKTISQLYMTHLTQEISYLHEPSESRFSLALDLSEAFKPMLVFGVILTLANRKQLNIGKHFEKGLNDCLLNEEGRKIFITEFDSKLESTFSHGQLGRKVTYRTALKLEGYKLVKFILEDVPFHTFSQRELF